MRRAGVGESEKKWKSLSWALTLVPQWVSCIAWWSLSCPLLENIGVHFSHIVSISIMCSAKNIRLITAKSVLLDGRVVWTECGRNPTVGGRMQVRSKYCDIHCIGGWLICMLFMAWGFQQQGDIHMLSFDFLMLSCEGHASCKHYTQAVMYESERCLFSLLPVLCK